LLPNTTYQFQLCGMNASVTVCGATLSFTTPYLPILINLKFYNEGFYVGSGFMRPAMKNRYQYIPSANATARDVDLYTVELHANDAANHYPLAGSSSFCEGMLQTPGAFTCTLPSNAQNINLVGGSYYDPPTR